MFSSGFFVRSWARNAKSWSWSWCPACWMELWTPTCCRGKWRLWILRSRWSLVWRRGLSTTGYHCPSVIAKRPVKTSSGKLSPPANSAQNHLTRLLPSLIHTNCSRPQLYISSTPVRHAASMDFTETVCRLNINYLCMYLCIHCMYYVCNSFFQG